MKLYARKGVEFEWGAKFMFLVGFHYEYKMITIALGPLFFEWSW